MSDQPAAPVPAPESPSLKSAAATAATGREVSPETPPVVQNELIAADDGNVSGQ